MSNLHVVVGLGASGLSCVKFLASRGVPIAINDTRAEPPQLAAFKAAFPDVPVSLGKLDAELLAQASTIIVSPGIALSEPAIAAQMARGIPVIGDIELFAHAVKAPVIAITGTNAKSTVTILVGKMAEACGYRVQVGGNLGTPALTLLVNDPLANLFVLELSSFQLETTYSLNTEVATILNISPDHMDRYADLSAYTHAKQRIYQHCNYAICNLDDAATDCNDYHVAKKCYFTLGTPSANQFGIQIKNNESYLAYGDRTLIPTAQLPVRGKHYQANALAALAIGAAFGMSFDSMLQVLREFPGLPHRCQFVREHNGVKWFNDSKGTNVGATHAAIEGLGSEIKGKLILIAGGVGKNADFSGLAALTAQYVRHAVLIGEAAQELAQVMHDHTAISFAKDMQQAVLQAANAAHPNDSVLLSPACASFDMFRHYEHRGEVFTDIVRKL